MSQSYTYYDILGIPRSRRDYRDATGGFNDELSKENLRTAYRRALLIHHPDKLPNDAQNKGADGNRVVDEHDLTLKDRFTIDEIVNAYNVLVDSSKRAEYDRILDLKDKTQGQGTASGVGSHIGVEVFDLEDLTYHEDKNIWTSGCRCGDSQGYVVTETDLERESQHGEIYVGCRGCSLFIKVLFAVEHP